MKEAQPSAAHRRLLPLAFAVALCAAPLNADESWRFTRVDMAPLSALQLGDAALVAPEVLDRLDAAPGRAAMLSSVSQEREVLLYPINRSSETVSIKRSLRDELGVVPGEATIELRLLDASESRLEPIDRPIRIDSQEGEPSLWPGFALGAPHGDCDLHTGDVVARTTRLCGVPSVCAYGSRISYLGRWIDVNRPLQRRPRPTDYGVLPYRDWTDEAIAIFTTFRDRALRVGTRPNYVPRPPAPRLVPRFPRARPHRDRQRKQATLPGCLRVHGAGL